MPSGFVTLCFSGNILRFSGEFGPDFDGIGQQIDGIVKNWSLPAGWVKAPFVLNITFSLLSPQRAARLQHGQARA
jgi:predicted nucleic acid-binding Zn ribbon protein